MRTQDEVQSLLRSVLAKVSADEAAVSYRGDKSIATRFGENAITQNIGGAMEEVRIEVYFGSRHAGTTTNRLDESALTAAVAKAENIARQSPEDPEYVQLPGPQSYGERPQRFFDDADGVTPQRVAHDVGIVVNRAKASGFTASGLFEVGSYYRAIANSFGLFAWDGSTEVDYSTTVHGSSGSGKAAQSQCSLERIDIDRLAQTASANAAAAQGPVEIEPGDYTVIFEPLAVKGVLGFMGWVMGARDADEGTSAFTDTVGTKLMDESVTIGLRVDDQTLPAPLYGEDGLAIKPVTWVERGVVKRLHHSRYWAKKSDTTPDAARLPLFIEGDDLGVDELVARCERGLLVKNLWYIRFVDRRSLILTGMTRDGVFLVEDGRIVRPVKNLRWNESPITFLHNVQALSRPERLSGWGQMKLPGILSTEFTFTSTTDSI